MNPLLLGIDIGTTSTKAIVCDAQGTVLAQAAQEYPTHYPHPNWAEQDPEDWWRATCFVLREIFANAGIHPNQIVGIGVSAQAPTMVLVDVEGRPLAPAQLWMDRRGEAACQWLHEHVGEETITQCNGGRIDPYYMAPKLLWSKTHRPDLYRATHKVLLANGYILHKLTGRFTLDMSQGPLTLFFESTQLRWSDRLLDKMGLNAEKLPPVLPCTQIAGEVTAQAAEATGLQAGTPVVVGMCDGTAAGIEAGLADVGDAVEMTGQSTVLLVCSDRPYLGKALIPLVHAAPGRWLIVGATVASGGALRWVRDQLGEVERQQAQAQGSDPFDLLTQQAATSPIGSHHLLFLPYLYGERSPIWDSDARGVFFGLSLATSKADLIRAVMEGAAYALRHNVDTALAGGFALQRLACVGGGARSALWNQIKADVLNRPLWLPKSGVGAPLGDAIVAAAGIGLHPSVEAAVQAMVAPGQTFYPNPAATTLYERFYEVYLGLYPALRQSFHQLAGVETAPTIPSLNF